LVQPLLFERRKNVKIVLNEESSEKSALAVTENVHLTEEADAMATVEDVVESEPIGFVLHVETITLHSEQNAIVVGNQSKETWQNVAAHSETIVEEEVVTIEEVVIKSSIIEMIGSALHVRMTTFLSEQNAINAANLDQEDNPVAETVVDVAETEEAATETTVEDEEETEEAEDVMVIVEDAEETEEVDSAEDVMVIVEDAEETEEADSAEDAMVIVEDAEETEEVDSAEDAMVIGEDAEETETVVEEMTVLENNIEKLVESDQVMLIIDHQKKSNHADINDAITMIIKVKS
jgi:hypothetical protein